MKREKRSIQTIRTEKKAGRKKKSICAEQVGLIKRVRKIIKKKEKKESKIVRENSA